MAELFFVGGFALLASAIAVGGWNSSRCSNKNVWFHDWIATGDKTTFDYTIGSHTYTATDEKMTCRHCNEEITVRIEDSCPEQDCSD